MAESATIQYVTAIYDIGLQSFAECMDIFKPFLHSPYKILVFTNQYDLKDLIGEFENVQVVFVSKNELGSFRQEDPQLPTGRNPEKDTLPFLQLLNAKSEFLYRASLIHSVADAFVWFDFDILKLSRDSPRFIRRMGRVQDALELYPDKIIIPGCIGMKNVDISRMFTSPIWRFCGGFLVVPRSRTYQFYEMNMLAMEEECFKHNRFTWDVNLWAYIEKNHPDMFHWYLADHNDSIVEVPLKPGKKRVIFLSMIKNESRIIRRCIESVLPIADAICICDTGSTDNTVELLREYFSDFQIPTKIYDGQEHLWKNFGHNRSQSFLAARDFCEKLGWDSEHVYALVLDADMQLVVLPTFDKNELTAIGYKMIQKSGTMEYYNSRFLKLAHSWKCVGPTHEYWDGGNTDTLTPDKIYISDIGDGGCKSDKFERDVRLLLGGLEESPGNPRYLFYLAQSYKDNKNLDEAIRYYKLRIEAGGWCEEIWYSMYQIMRLYAEQGNIPEMEMWGMKAFEYRRERSENLLFLCRFFKDKRQYWKAWHYWSLGSQIKKPDDLLFIETECYEGGFDMERAIIHDYVFPHKKLESVEYSLELYNKWNVHYGYTNIQWFIEKIPLTLQRNLRFYDIGDYVATSTSIIPYGDDMYCLNVRYVNYRIQPNGSYLMSENGRLDGGNPVRTENYVTYMDKDLNLVAPLRRMEITQPPLHNTHIKGLEDVRLFYGEGNTLKFFGTTMNYSHDGKIRQVMGDYNLENGTMEHLKPLRPPGETDCEKNWIPYKDGRIIYSWHPFQIGKLDEEGRLQIEVRQNTPRFMYNMRGSTTLVLDGEYYYGITHCVMYTAPRKYYHTVVKIHAATDRVVSHTQPFYFMKNAIEYCLGYIKRGDEHLAIVSQNDRDPVLVRFHETSLKWYDV